MGPWFLSLAYEGLRDYTNALAWAERIRQLDRSPDTISQIGRLHARLGHREEALKALEGVRVLAQSPGGARAYAAEVLLALGDRDRAIDDLRRAVDEYPPSVLGLKSYPLWDELRDDPRFQALLERMSLKK
jgi:tetratricopeptide (TPR) repeat protein